MYQESPATGSLSPVTSKESPCRIPFLGQFLEPLLVLFVSDDSKAPDRDLPVYQDKVTTAEAGRGEGSLAATVQGRIVPCKMHANATEEVLKMGPLRGEQGSGVVEPTCNLCTQEAKAGRSL